MNSANLPVEVVYAADMTHEYFMAHYFEPRIPVLLKNACANWDFMRKWSIDYLIQTQGDAQCVITGDSRPARADTKSSLQEYFTVHCKNAMSTFTNTPFDSTTSSLPSFLIDIPLPNPFFSQEDITVFAFFHANGQDGTLPHVHNDAFNLLQKGVKKWVLFDAAPDSAPDGWEALKQCFREYPAGTHAKDWFVKEPNQLRQQGIAVYECWQEAGDIVFIPEYFSHAILNYSEVLGLVVQRSRLPQRAYQPHALTEALHPQI